MRKAILAAIAALGIATSASAQSANIEAVLNKTSAITDTKVSVPVKGDVSIFARNRLGVGYDKINWDFSLVDLNLYKKGNAWVFAETQYVKSGPLMPFIGMGYSLGKGSFSTTIIPDMRVGKVEGMLQTINTYSRPITGKANAVVRLETFVGDSKSGPAWATERARIGVKHNSYEAGAALDISQSTGAKPSYFAGIYARKGF